MDSVVVIEKTKIKSRQKMQISSLSFDKDELRRFCDILQERANAAAEIEASLFLQNDQTQEEYERNLVTLRESFTLKITIAGTNGEELWGTISEVFDSVNFPENVKSLYVDSQSTLKHVHNYYPHNYFVVFLDFSKPKVLDFSLLPSYGTPNESNLEVSGYDATWVNGVFSELKNYISSKSSTLSVVHRHSIYDVLLWFMGFPLSFWICSRFSPYIENLKISSVFFESALYMYSFVATLFVFRLLFHYLRWVCPLVEFRLANNKMLMHRAIFGVLSVGWFGQFAYDLVKWVM
ncbi:TPA: hypothetical protein ACPJ00_000787 [Vibrio diabolicus]